MAAVIPRVDPARSTYVAVNPAGIDVMVPEVPGANASAEPSQIDPGPALDAYRHHHHRRLSLKLHRVGARPPHRSP